MKHAVLDTPIVKFHKMCEDIDKWLAGRSLAATDCANTKSIGVQKGDSAEVVLVPWTRGSCARIKLKPLAYGS